MYEKDYNNLISNLSNVLIPVNQLLYQILIIIAIYIYLEKLQSSSLFFSRNNSSIIIIFAILAISLD